MKLRRSARALLPTLLALLGGCGPGELGPDHDNAAYQWPERAGAQAVDPPWPADEPLPPEFDMPPWVNMPEPNRIVVSWRTVADSTGTVRFGTSPEYGQTVTTTDHAQLHHADLGVLQPATAYWYEVAVDGTPARRRGYFVTPGRETWRFVHFGEFHAPTDADWTRRFAATIRAFRPHVFVESGDMVDDGDNLDHWRSYMRAAAPWISNGILLPAGSNHVNGPGGNAHYREMFVLPGNERWYTTRYGQVQFFTLDSTFDGSNADVRREQPRWIAEQNALARDGVDDPTFTVGAWHYPACSSRYATRALQRVGVHSYLLGPFARSGGLDLALVGHDKYYERSRIGDTIHVQANAGKRAPGAQGFDFPGCEPQVTRTDVRSLVLVEVANRTLTARVVDGAANPIDAFEIRR